MAEVNLKALISISLACVVFFVVLGCSSLPRSPSGTTSLDSSQPKVRELIEALVSKYPPLFPDGHWPGGGGGIFGDDKLTPEDEEGDRVLRVREQLRDIGMPAFDALISARVDERYSYSWVYAAWRNHSVGDACFMIVESQVVFHGFGYKSREAADGRHAVKPSYLRHLRAQKRLGQWWADRRGRTLRELQVESLEWTIAQERFLGFTDDEQRDRILKPLEERLAELQKQSP